MSEEAKIIRDAVHGNWWFYTLAGIAILLIIASFIVPPLGYLEPTVLAGVGEIFAFAALGTVIKAIDQGRTASITHGNTTIEVKKEDGDDETEVFQP